MGSDAEEYSFCLARVVPYAGDFARYGHGSLLERCDGLAAEALVTTRKTYFVQRDQLGSTVALTDGSGSVVQRYSYDAFGKAYVGVGETGSGAVAEWVPVSEFAGSLHGNDRLYTGREYDAETGLYYYRARHYDAGTGRFLQRDPVGVADQANLYAYVGNGPVGRTDPSGMFIKEAAIQTGEIVGTSDAANGLANVAVYWQGYLTDDQIMQKLGEEGMRDSLGNLVDPSKFVMNRVKKVQIIGNGAIGFVERKANPILKNIEKIASNKLKFKPTTRGEAPKCADCKPIEIHHSGQNPNGPFVEMTRAEHRLGENYKSNHPNIGQSSKIDRGQFSTWKKEYWKNEWDSWRFENLK